jgi:hypothetical protein
MHSSYNVHIQIIKVCVPRLKIDISALSVPPCCGWRLDDCFIFRFSGLILNFEGFCFGNESPQSQ